MHRTALLFLLSFATSLAIADLALATTCQNLETRDSTMFNQLQELYKFAQLSEAPKHASSAYMADCEVNSQRIVAAPKDVQFIPPTMEFVESLGNHLVQHTNDRAYIAVGDSGTFYVGCQGDGAGVLVGIKLGVHFIAGLVEYHLSIDLLGKPSEPDIGDRSARVNAVELRDIENNIIYAFRGTNLRDMKQLAANFVGDKCVFPVVSAAIGKLCSDFIQAQHSGPLDSDTVEASNQQLSIYMVGHSLGGLVVQHVASSLPASCRRDQIEELGASLVDLGFFAFASPGMLGNTASVVEASRLRSVRNFVLECDVVLMSTFPNRVQVGESLTYGASSRNDGVISGMRHSIDKIQKGICLCLSGRGALHSDSEWRPERDRSIVRNQARCSDSRSANLGYSDIF